jgi:flagellar biosynthesis protein FlhF
MQIKKFEAPTIQEALDHIKRELGPEAIILQTKKNRKGFGLMSSGSVEVTVAVSDRSLQKKTFAENRIPTEQREQVSKLPAERQAEIYDKMVDKHLERMANKTEDQVSLSSGTAQSNTQAATSKKSLTATRYIDIEDAGGKAQISQKGRQAEEASENVYRKPAPSSERKQNLEEELVLMKRMLTELKSNQEESALATGGAGASALVPKPALATPALLNAFEHLVVNGVDKFYAMQLIRSAQFTLGDKASESPDAVLDQLALEIMENAQVESLLEGLKAGTGEGPAIVAIVGPTGVGKTTTLAKIASQCIKEKNLKVGLINIDNFKVAAFDQIATYAKILNVPFRSVGADADLKIALQDFKALDLVLIDTTGRSQKEVDSLKEMEALVHSIPQVRTYLALSVATRDAELYEMGRRFGIFRPEGLILSKLDEALSFGSMYNISQRLKLPLAYFTTGQRVPDDLEPATRERLAALVLDLQFDGAEEGESNL